MIKALMDGLVAKFLESYKAREKDAIWRKQSTEFRRFWSDQVLAKGTGIISDDECDKVIRILDQNGKGNTKGNEVVAKTGVNNDVWRKLFNGLHSDQKLASLVDSSLKETNLERKTALLDELHRANEGKNNWLTGKGGNVINALLAAYDPVKNLSSVSLKHREMQMDFLQLKLTFDWDQASFGQRIVQSNLLLCEGTRALGLDGTARTLSAFWYSGPISEHWKPEHTVKRTDKEKVPRPARIRHCLFAGSLHEAGQPEAFTPKNDAPPVDMQAVSLSRVASGQIAEDIAFQAEKERLQQEGRDDLAGQVERVADRPGLGFDIKSFDADEMPRCIEVKNVSGGNRFFLTYGEWQNSRTRPNYWFYLVSGVDTNRHLVTFLAAAKIQAHHLQATQYLVTFTP
jgi:Domain of unknown function (DUF3883)